MSDGKIALQKRVTHYYIHSQKIFMIAIILCTIIKNNGFMTCNLHSNFLLCLNTIDWPLQYYFYSLFVAGWWIYITEEKINYLTSLAHQSRDNHQIDYERTHTRNLNRLKQSHNGTDGRFRPQHNKKEM